MSSRVEGAAGFKRRLKKMPEAVSAEIVEVLDRGGARIRAAMQARARRRTGKLIEGVKYQVLPKSLRMRVGLLGSKRGRSKLFYGFILDRGRSTGRVTIKRGKRRGQSLLIRYLRGDHFVSGRYTELRDLIGRESKRVFERALARIAGGARE